MFLSGPVLVQVPNLVPELTLPTLSASVSVLGIPGIAVLADGVTVQSLVSDVVYLTHYILPEPNSNLLEAEHWWQSSTGVRPGTNLFPHPRHAVI